MESAIYTLALPDNGSEELFMAASPISGTGLFTCKALPKNTMICRLLGNHHDLPASALFQLLDLGPEKNRSVNPDHTLRLVNHSCRPNAYLTGNGTLISSNNIDADDEICIDYGLLHATIAWHMVCTCKAPGCRHLIVALN